MSKVLLLGKGLISSFYQKEIHDNLFLIKNENSKWTLNSKTKKGDFVKLCSHEFEKKDIFTWLNTNVDEDKKNKLNFHLKNICLQCHDQMKINAFNHKKFSTLFDDELIDSLIYKNGNIRETNIEREKKKKNLREKEESNLNKILKLKIQDFKNALNKIIETNISNTQENLDEIDLNSSKNQNCNFLLEHLPDALQWQMLKAIADGVISDLTEGLAIWFYFLVHVQYSETYTKYFKHPANFSHRNALYDLIAVISFEYNLLYEKCGIKKDYKDDIHNFFVFFKEEKGNCVMSTTNLYNIVKMLTKDVNLHIAGWRGHVNICFLNYDIKNHNTFKRYWIDNLKLSDDDDENELVLNLDNRLLLPPSYNFPVVKNSIYGNFIYKDNLEMQDKLDKYKNGKLDYDEKQVFFYKLQKEFCLIILETTIDNVNDYHYRTFSNYLTTYNDEFRGIVFKNGDVLIQSIANDFNKCHNFILQYILTSDTFKNSKYSQEFETLNQEVYDFTEMNRLLTSIKISFSASKKSIWQFNKLIAELWEFNRDPPKNYEDFKLALMNINYDIKSFFKKDQKRVLITHLLTIMKVLIYVTFWNINLKPKNSTEESCMELVIESILLLELIHVIIEEQRQNEKEKIKNMSSDELEDRNDSILDKVIAHIEYNPFDPNEDVEFSNSELNRFLNFEEQNNETIYE